MPQDPEAYSSLDISKDLPRKSLFSQDITQLSFDHPLYFPTLSEDNHPLLIHRGNGGHQSRMSSNVQSC